MSYELKELKEYAGIAQQILGPGTKYYNDKQIISEAFKPDNKITINTLIYRLTIIDSYYSTQMNKRLFGIEDLADKLLELSTDDHIMKRMFVEYLIKPEDNRNIHILFNNEYGIDKTGQSYGKAESLITKYAYFLTMYNFPIYDSLVKKAYKHITSLYPSLNIQALSNDIDIYIKRLKDLKELTDIDNYDKLDNALWLCGKIRDGRFSLILSKDNYITLTSNLV